MFWKRSPHCDIQRPGEACHTSASWKNKWTYQAVYTKRKCDYNQTIPLTEPIFFFSFCFGHCIYCKYTLCYTNWDGKIYFKKCSLFLLKLSSSLNSSFFHKKGMRMRHDCLLSGWLPFANIWSLIWHNMGAKHCEWTKCYLTVWVNFVIKYEFNWNRST